MSKEVKRLLRDRYTSYDIYNYSPHLYPVEDNLGNILIHALRGLEDFDTGWFPQRENRHGYIPSGKKEFGRIYRVGNTLTCMVESVSEFDEKGLAEELLDLKAVMHPIRALKAIIDLFEKAEQKADERREQNKTVEQYHILKNGHSAQIYLVPVGKGLQMERPPHHFYDRWGFQGRNKGFHPVPIEVKRWVFRYTEDTAAFNRDCVSEDGHPPVHYVWKRIHLGLGEDTWTIQFIEDLGVRRQGNNDE